MQRSGLKILLCNLETKTLSTPDHESENPFQNRKNPKPTTTQRESYYEAKLRTTPTIMEQPSSRSGGASVEKGEIWGARARRPNAFRVLAGVGGLDEKDQRRVLWRRRRGERRGVVPLWYRKKESIHKVSPYQ